MGGQDIEIKTVRSYGVSNEFKKIYDVLLLNNIIKEAGEKPRNVLMNFIDSKIGYYATNPHGMLYSCFKLYNSKEYQAEIERIVKKYCEECE